MKTEDKVWFVIGASIMSAGIVSFIWGFFNVILPSLD